MLIIGLDDTDILTSRGTGHLAREIADALTPYAHVLGVTRHQLLRDPRVPCTKNNSSAAILLDEDVTADSNEQVAELFSRVRAWMLDAFIEGSDPGLCVAAVVPQEITAFGRRVQSQLVSRDEARQLARNHGVTLAALGGDESGVIGALAAVGLAAGGSDGRYIRVGRIRELQGLQPVSALLEAGVTAVRTLDGTPVSDGMVQTDKLRPARRNGMPVAVVEQQDGVWVPLKLD